MNEYLPHLCNLLEVSKTPVFTSLLHIEAIEMRLFMKFIKNTKCNSLNKLNIL